MAVSAAVEGFFRFGDRWRHYRSLVEELKSEGWDFHELTGSYRAEGATFESAFPTFVQRVNDVLAGEQPSRRVALLDVLDLEEHPPA